MIYIWYILYIYIYNIHPNRIISNTSTLTTPLAPLDTAVLHPQCYQWSNKPRHQGKTTGDQNGFIWIAGRFSPKFIPSAGISGLPWITEVAAWILQICWVKTPPFRPKWLAFMDDLWIIFGWFMDDFWMIFGWFLDDLWVHPLKWCASHRIPCQARSAWLQLPIQDISGVGLNGLSGQPAHGDTLTIAIFVRKKYGKIWENYD